MRKVIGPFASPKKIYVVSDLPKTRSGKIMRRIMRKVIAGEGDQPCQQVVIQIDRKAEVDKPGSL